MKYIVTLQSLVIIALVGYISCKNRPQIDSIQGKELEDGEYFSSATPVQSSKEVTDSSDVRTTLKNHDAVVSVRTTAKTPGNHQTGVVGDKIPKSTNESQTSSTMGANSHPLNPSIVCGDSYKIEMVEDIRGTLFPVGSTTFQELTKTFDYEIYPKQITSDTVVYKKDSEYRAITKLKIKSQNIESTMEITDSNITFLKTTKSLRKSIDPYMGIISDGKTISPSVGFTLLKYGNEISDYKLLSLGVSYSGYLSFDMIPVSVNIKPVTLVTKNTFLSVGISYSERGFSPLIGITFDL